MAKFDIIQPGSFDSRIESPNLESSRSALSGGDRRRGGPDECRSVSGDKVSLNGVERRVRMGLSAAPEFPRRSRRPGSQADRVSSQRRPSEGTGRAKFLKEELGITNDDWKYLQAQLEDALPAATFDDVRLDDHGIRFNAVLPIVGRTSRIATMLTGWIVRSGERARSLPPSRPTIVPVPTRSRPFLQSCQWISRATHAEALSSRSLTRKARGSSAKACRLR
jgi:hypothetical protein